MATVIALGESDAHGDEVGDDRGNDRGNDRSDDREDDTADSASGVVVKVLMFLRFHLGRRRGSLQLEQPHDPARRFQRDSEMPLTLLAHSRLSHSKRLAR